MSKRARDGDTGARRFSRHCKAPVTRSASNRAWSSGDGVARSHDPVSRCQSAPFREYRPYLTVRQNRPIPSSQVMNTCSVGLPSGGQWRRAKAGTPSVPPPARMAPVARSPHAFRCCRGKGGLWVASISLLNPVSRALQRREPRKPQAGDHTATWEPVGDG